ncbi:hypothetical protein CTI12_AA079260 [Artemisia annua]|uniref:Uncharacterized protein n=1 Tax=Artemisia annua TaxID=35608 RepID=A0A2U1PQG3_ARTAN|nr:hypothetical protein CTI12_AA079260 [Artemisia annua]
MGPKKQEGWSERIGSYLSSIKGSIKAPSFTTAIGQRFTSQPGPSTHHNQAPTITEQVWSSMTSTVGSLHTAANQAPSLTQCIGRNGVTEQGSGSQSTQNQPPTENDLFAHQFDPNPRYKYKDIK